MSEHAEVLQQFRKQSLHATVIRACRKCGAPGFWHDDPNGNRACYDPVKKREAALTDSGFASVGKICPSCGANRDDDEYLGEIWSKVWRGPTLLEFIKQKLFLAWRFK